MVNPQSCVLSYLSQGGRLTVRKAERLFHTTELRRIISRLRRKGYVICDTTVHTLTADGRYTSFKEYYLQAADA